MSTFSPADSWFNEYGIFGYGTVDVSLSHQFDQLSTNRQLSVIISCGIADRFQLKVEVEGFETVDMILPARGYAYKHEYPFPVLGSKCVITLTDTTNGTVEIRELVIRPSLVRSFSKSVEIEDKATFKIIMWVGCPDHQTKTNWFYVAFTPTSIRYPDMVFRSRLIRSWDEDHVFSDIVTKNIWASTMGSAEDYSSATVEVSVYVGTSIIEVLTFEVPFYFVQFKSIENFRGIYPLNKPDTFTGVYGILPT
jgi:hypothetical protein